MRYVILLRGINVGGKHKVVMSELKQQVEALGFANVVTYINSGNVFFDSNEAKTVIQHQLEDMFAQHYSFPLGFALISANELRAELDDLPEWWSDNHARKDVLFYLENVDKAHIEAHIRQWTLENERIYYGKHAIFWAKLDNDQYLQTAYAKYLAKAPFYKAVSIRNGKTFDKIQALIGLNQ
ncbi:DUF1697 domain-containing protein [Aerococcaceae bacterium NML180378]|nr:DUF1697 domain-containing protein [Aerococcaceae bacterium NML180378]